MTRSQRVVHSRHSRRRSSRRKGTGDRHQTHPEAVSIRRRYADNYIANEVLTFFNDRGYAVRKILYFLRAMIAAVAVLAAWQLILMAVGM